jgi:hypothetical protein
MSAAVVIALISAVVAVGSAVISGYMTVRSVRLEHALADRRAEADRREASEDVVRRYREPLLLAVFDLQTRLCNIVKDGFVARHLGSADPEEQEYARASTLYRVGDYLGWAEILRRDLQVLDLGEDKKTHELVERLNLVSRTFANTDWFPAGLFRLFRDEQRAVGEIMLEPVAGQVRQYQCIGYAAFVSRLESDPAFERWFRRLRTEIGSLAEARPGLVDRLIALQRALVDVIDVLDPQGIRLPKEYVKRLATPPGQPWPGPASEASPDPAVD